MKSQFFARLQSGVALSRKDIALTLIPALLWAGGVFSRPYLIQAHCVADPKSCTQQSVLAMDQPALGLNSTAADQISYFTQNLSGAVAAAVPAAWNIASAVTRKISPAAALSATLTDWLLVFQTAAWNGTGVELSHLISQRPRPYVYADPELARNPSNYTSFYSGHTSFAAAASVALFLILLGRGAPAWLLALTAISGELLVVATAACRVLAGRHFLTDVMAGAVAGTFVALAVALLHRRAPAETKTSVEFGQPGHVIHH